jgi:aconitate hydratase
MRAYYQAQGLFGIPKAEQCDYSQVLNLDLGTVKPSVAGPKRPQDRINLYALKESFETLLELPKEDGGYGKTEPAPAGGLRHGDVVIAAITSCTNTSNPGVMLAAGLLAKKAVALGLKTPAHVKTSLGPGSRAVTEYLKSAGLLDSLAQLGFGVVGYGCTTCIGNSGPLPEAIEKEDSRQRPDRLLGALRQPQLRSARASERQGQLPDVAAAGGRLRPRRPGRHRRRQRAHRPRARPARCS